MKFNLSDIVTIKESGESGVIIGRAEYLTSETQYFLRYKNGQGVAVEQWWSESAIKYGANP